MFHKRIRAWHTEKKTMYKVSELDFDNEIVNLCAFRNKPKYHLDFLMTKFINVIFMQQSGLSDDNNFSTFEGDILEFEKTLFVLSYGWYGNSSTGSNGYGWHLKGKIYKVPYFGGAKKVGNIYENPDLIGE